MLLHDGTAFSVNGSLYPNLPFDYRKDFEPVFLVSLVPNILVVTPSVPVKTVADVIAYAKAQPDGINMASSGNGTLQHLCLEMFRHVTGIKINHVPYRGGGLALTDVMSGQVKFFFANGSSVVGLIKGGKVKAIAHTGTGRLASLPDIPPVSDTLPGFEAYEWNGVFVPHGTPKAIVTKLNAALNQALVSPEVSARFKQLNIVSRPNTPEEFRAFVEGQMKLWSSVVKEANIHLGDDPCPRTAAIAGPVAQPKKPRILPPPGAWDSHCHVFGPADKFPYAAGRGYTPPDAPVEKYLALLDHNGCDLGLRGAGQRARLRQPRRARRAVALSASAARRRHHRYAHQAGNAARLAQTRHARPALSLLRREADLYPRRRLRRVRGVPQDHGRARLGDADLLRLGACWRTMRRGCARSRATCR